MAVQVEVKLICDYCSASEAGVVRGTQTKRFGADGSSYEVDVCDKHGELLDKTLAPWVRVSRKAGTKPRQIGRAAKSGIKAASSRRTGEKYKLEDYWLWAEMKGLKINREAKRPNPRLLRQFLDDTQPKG